MDLRLLRYFVAVIEHDGLRRAAGELHLAPSALSRALRQLEGDLGVELFHRAPSGMRPTAAGRDLLEHARSLLAAADEASAVMRAHAQRSTTLRVGLLGGRLVASELTLPILHEFQAAHPEMCLQTTAISFDRQLDPLLDGEVDVALIHGPVTHRQLDLIPIARQPRVLLVRASRDLAAEPSVDVHEILAERTVTLCGPPEWTAFWQMDTLRGRMNLHPDLGPARTVEQMQSAVAHGAVISTSGAVSRLMPTRTTRSVHLRGAEHSTIAVARRRGDRRRNVDLFIETAASTAEQRIAMIPGGTRT